MKIDLDKLTVAAPCHADWNTMSGDDRARFCQLCKRHVYNISAMSRTEAEALILEKEGSLCLRFARRADGTVVVDNCPVGLRAIRNRLRWIGAGVAAVFTFVGGAMLGNVNGVSASQRASIKAWFFPPANVPRCETKERASIKAWFFPPPNVPQCVTMGTPPMPPCGPARPPVAPATQSNAASGNTTDEN